MEHSDRSLVGLGEKANEAIQGTVIKKKGKTVHHSDKC